jgi:hypothetical protein
VRAVYDQQRIAFQVRWHDMRADAGGQNSPTLEVPLSEEEPPPAAQTAGGGGKGGGDFWGEEQAGAPAAAPEAPAAKAGGEADFWGEGGAAQPATGAPAAEFSDAVAVQLPRELPEGIARPYFLFGDGQLAVDLWFLDLAAGRRVRQFVGHGTGALTVQEGSDVEGRGSYAAGEWSAVFARELRATGGVSFTEGSYVPIAFTVWDGTARERGNRRALTQWCYVYLEPREKPSAVVPMAGTALAVLALELLAVFALRRRFGASVPAA